MNPIWPSRVYDLWRGDIHKIRHLAQDYREHMEEIEALYNLSEVAITLAGFIAIATVLRARDSATAGATRVRVINLLVASFGILLLSQIAIALLHANVQEQMTWQTSSAFWVLVTISASIYNLRNHTMMVEAGMGLPKLLNWLQWTTLLFVLVLQLFNILMLKTFWPFLVGMISILVVAGISFTIIIMQFLREPSR